MSRLTDLLWNLVKAGPRSARVPATSHGASSFHLVWEMPAGLAGHARWTEVSAVLEVLVPPRVSALYFWALQVDFVDDGGVWGGAHTGLQWNERYPGSTAVNWGGYASHEHGGTVLAGTHSTLPGFTDDPNTLAFPWEPGHRYRFKVYRSPDTPGAWRAAVGDERSGESTAIRDLLPLPGRQTSGSYLTRPLVWSEVFADCRAPSVTVRWSDFEAFDEAGTLTIPRQMRVNYQSEEEGGCANTSVGVDARGVLQITNTKRLIGQGTAITLPVPGPSKMK